MLITSGQKSNADDLLGRGDYALELSMSSEVDQIEYFDQWGVLSCKGAPQGEWKIGYSIN